MIYMIEFGDKCKTKSTSGHVIAVRLRIRVKTIEIIFPSGEHFNNFSNIILVFTPATEGTSHAPIKRLTEDHSINSTGNN